MFNGKRTPASMIKALPMHCRGAAFRSRMAPLRYLFTNTLTFLTYTRQPLEIFINFQHAGTAPCAISDKKIFDTTLMKTWKQTEST